MFRHHPIACCLIPGTFAIIAVFTCLAFTHRTVYSRQSDPTGKYTAITSYKTYLSFLPMAPGQSSDKACFVKIVDAKGVNCGEIPVAMLQMAQVNWLHDGANITLAGEWYFARVNYYYLSEDQTSYIYVRTGR